MGRKEKRKRACSNDSGGGQKKEWRLVWWLGIWIDRERNFKEHVHRKIAGSKRLVAVIQRLGGGSKGLGVGNARTINIECARTTMDYGSRVWWGGQKGLANQMDKADETAMRKMKGHFRSAPGAAIAIENDMKLAAVRLNERQTKNTCKLLSQRADQPLGTLMRKEIEVRQEEAEWGGGSRPRVKKRAGVMKGVKRMHARIAGKWKKVEKTRKA